MIKQLLTYLAFVALATLIWWGHAYNTVRDNTVEVRMIYTGRPSDVKLSQPLPEFIQIHILDDGSHLRHLQRSKPSLTFDLKNYFREDHGEINLSNEKLRNAVEDILPETSRLVRIEPENIRAAYQHPRTEKVLTVPIRVRNVPKGKKMHLFPNQAEVTLQLRLDQFREVTEKDVNVYCEYPQEPTDAIPVQVEVKTTKAKCTTIKPEKVEYIVEI